jgi:hypothetical protein
MRCKLIATNILFKYFRTFKSKSVPLKNLTFLHPGDNYSSGFVLQTGVLSVFSLYEATASGIDTFTFTFFKIQ